MVLVLLMSLGSRWSRWGAACCFRLQLAACMMQTHQGPLPGTGHLASSIACFAGAGQGFRPSESTVVGATDVLTVARQLYVKSSSWRGIYKRSPASACNKSGSKSLCAAAAASEVDAYAELLMAASPQVYSSLNAKFTGGVRLRSGTSSKPAGNSSSISSRDSHDIC
eukprot:GHUV01036260.1.p1 GENE.GHUV01036260.1~~GHUV01036260.1.p1  ORF type:complete len:167 (-),score=41.31 GHUV01036260.1:442-942(-)